MQQSDELKNVIGALDTETCSILQKAGFTLQPLNELWCGNCRPVNLSTMALWKAVQAINEKLGGDGSEMLEASQLRGSQLDDA